MQGGHPNSSAIQNLENFLLMANLQNDGAEKKTDPIVLLWQMPRTRSMAMLEIGEPSFVHTRIDIIVLDLNLLTTSRQEGLSPLA
jgi:hypothetical protein